MNIYPVIIPTLNRYVHLKRCIESLKSNTHANETELIIGLDYPPAEKYVDGYKKVKEYVYSLIGFRKVTVLERTENYGPEKNYSDLIKYAYNYYDAVIFTEDDNEFSPCFLDFMNKALEKYRDDDRVSCVQGYNDDKYRKYPGSNVMFVRSGGAWGFGQWRDKQYMLDVDSVFSRRVLSSFRDSWKIFTTFPAVLNMLISMDQKKVIWGDICYSCLNVLNNRYQLKPRISLVRNLGNDGSGLHCGVDSHYSEQYIETAKVFDLDEVEVKLESHKYLQFFSLLSENKIKALIQVLFIFKRYFSYFMKLNSK